MAYNGLQVIKITSNNKFKKLHYLNTLFIQVIIL